MRPRTISLRLPIAPDESVKYPRGVERPVTRGDCAEGPRPCPWVSCKYHLFLDVTRAGSLKLNFPSDSLDGLVENLANLKESCALDVAGGVGGDGDGVTLEDVGGLMNVTRERIRQMEEKFQKRLKEDPAVRAALGEEDQYWRAGTTPPALPGEVARRKRAGAADGVVTADMLEVPDDLFDVFDELEEESGTRPVAPVDVDRGSHDRPIAQPENGDAKRTA